MHTFLTIVLCVSAILLVVLVLLHSAKADGLGSVGGAATLFNSQKGLETGLNRMTTVVTIIFMVTAFILSALK